jgi:hypothetical protein
MSGRDEERPVVGGRIGRWILRAAGGHHEHAAVPALAPGSGGALGGDPGRVDLARAVRERRGEGGGSGCTSITCR